MHIFWTSDFNSKNQKEFIEWKVDKDLYIGMFIAMYFVMWKLNLHIYDIYKWEKYLKLYDPFIGGFYIYF